MLWFQSTSSPFFGNGNGTVDEPEPTTPFALAARSALPANFLTSSVTLAG